MADGNASIIQTRLEERTESGRVAYVTVNNPAKHNAMTSDERGALADTMNQLALEADLRVVVLTGAGAKAFMGGANIGQMSSFPNTNVAGSASAQTHRACDSMRRMPVPVIARINGYCLGAGMEIATACDMRVASSNAMFGMPEVKYGLPSGMEACLLPRLIGWGKTMELVYTGEMIDAEEAHRVGYVDRLVAPEELDAAVEKWVKSICTAGPRAIRLQKELCADWERMSIADAVQRGIAQVARAHETDEPRRLMTQFLERKKNKQ